MSYVVDEAMVEELWLRNSELLRNLKAGRRWVAETASRFNEWVAELAASGDEGKSYAPGGAWNNLFEHLVWDYERVSAFAPSLLELCSYALRLPEMKVPGTWKGFARRLTSDDPGRFRSALAELAVHRWVRSVGADITFNFGSRHERRCDYTITLSNRVVDAELKSILPGVQNEEAAAHLIERAYAEAFVKRQLMPNGNSVVFVDVSGWHELAIKLFLSHMVHHTAPKRLRLPKVAARCRPAPGLDIRTAPLLLVLLEPNVARVARIVEVEAPTPAAA